ncbi:hypothetical protein Tco_0156178 [Tanacetum coccineum]
MKADLNTTIDISESIPSSLLLIYPRASHHQKLSALKLQQRSILSPQMNMRLSLLIPSIFQAMKTSKHIRSCRGMDHTISMLDGSIQCMRYKAGCLFITLIYPRASHHQKLSALKLQQRSILSAPDEYAVEPLNPVYFSSNEDIEAHQKL